MLEFIVHFHAHSTKNPEAWGLGVGRYAVGTNPARPYGLPMASVSKESVSREVRFITSELVDTNGTGSTNVRIYVASQLQSRLPVGNHGLGYGASVTKCKPDPKITRLVRRQFHDAQDIAPAGVTVDRWGPDLTVTRSWRTPTLWFYTAGCVAWNAFVVFWYSLLISQLTSDHPPRGAWIAAFVTIPHAIGGLCFAYATLCRCVNRTRIHVASNEISVQHGPLPWLGNCRIVLHQLKQLFCIERKHPRKGQPRLTYEVLAWQADDNYETVLSGLEDLHQALFIERQIEEFLGLVEEHVPPGFQLGAEPPS